MSNMILEKTPESAQSHLPKRRFQFKPRTVLTHALLLILVVVNIFPLYWMLTFSLKTNDEIMGRDKAVVTEVVTEVDPETGETVEKTVEKTVRLPQNHIGLPRHWEWNNYPAAMKTGNMGRLFLNSLLVSAATIVITIIASFMATYAITRLVWQGRKLMNKFFMLGLTIPIHAALIPVYIILSRINLLGTYVSLIIPSAAFSLAMGILISTGFMGDIPYDLDEAAFLDGCGVWGIFFRVILPLMMPAISTLGIYTFLQCWNELLLATVYISDPNRFTLPVGINQFFGQYTTDWGKIGAGLVIATAPTLVVYIALSKRIQAGFIAGAVKG
jgi:raffinose/stachyose/melibiose transport system permease protein